MTELKPDASGRIPAIVQDRLTGQVRTLAWMTPEAVARAERDGRAGFVGQNAEIPVVRVVLDCDANALLVLTDTEQPTCDRGHWACFGATEADAAPAEPFVSELVRTIAERRESTAERSYTKSLLAAGSGKIGEKLREEADELARAIAQESDDRVANEAADVLFHLLVALELRDVTLRQVIEVLAQRSGTSGHAEKASRPVRSG